jgi:hypothetical protein
MNASAGAERGKLALTMTTTPRVGRTTTTSVATRGIVLDQAAAARAEQTATRARGGDGRCPDWVRAAPRVVRCGGSLAWAKPSAHLAEAHDESRMDLGANAAPSDIGPG